MYNPQSIEPKWQARWAELEVAKTIEDPNKPKIFIPAQFPYPSGEWLHAGHTKVYAAADIIARKKKLEGYSVLHPMGWDAFGLPAENFAIKHGVHPRVAIDKNIATFKAQLSRFGGMYDWDREINTTDADYYHWSQWIFVKLYNHFYDREMQRARPIEELAIPAGLTESAKKEYIDHHRLAFVDYKPINWCPNCKTGLANEDLEDGKCERCGSEIERKPMRQWVLRITEYGDRLVEGLRDLNWDNSMKELERDWIGRSEGCEFRMVRKVATRANTKPTALILHGFGDQGGAHWGTWLAQELERVGYEVYMPSVPFESGDMQACLDVLRSAHYRIDQDSIIIGHSMGSVLGLKFIESLDGKVGRFVSVAPAFTGMSMEKTYATSERIRSLSSIIESLTATSIDYRSVRAKIGESIVFTSDNEPLIDTQEQYDFFASHGLLNRYLVLAKKGHFTSHRDNMTTFPEFFDTVVPSISVYTTRVDTVYGMSYVVMAPDHPSVSDFITDAQRTECDRYIAETKAKTDLDRTELNKEKTGVFTGSYVINPFNGESVPLWIADYVLGSYGTGAVMAVPAHDERDFAFAKKYDLPIVKVIVSAQENAEYDSLDGRFDPDLNSAENDAILDRMDAIEDVLEGDKAMTDDGFLIKVNGNDDQFLDTILGLSSAEARTKLAEKAESEWFGRKKTNYKLRDWVFSRQRYWGEPIPMIHCEDHGFVAMREEELPLRLPEVENYQPTGTEEGPLANIEEWINTTCPICGKSAKRESNTMPQWAGSSWYWLRYMDPHNTKELVSKERENYWKAVDIYIGGVEHVTRHMIYARFWNMFLYDIGVVSVREPFPRFQQIGLVLAEDGRKMSKRWGNVINPTDIMNEHGADTLRTYQMFMGPYDQSVAWNSNALKWVERFLERVEKLSGRVQSGYEDDAKIITLLHKTIKKVSEDIDGFKFNTAVSALMILSNALEERTTISAETFETFLLILAPFAPHLADELYERLGHKTSLFVESRWPEYDIEKCVDDEITIAVQINGKLRGSYTFLPGVSQEEVSIIVQEKEEISKWIEWKEIVREIFVPNKLINIVVKDQ